MVGLATETERPNLHYDLINPATGINYGKPLKGWRYDRNTMNRLIEEKRILWPSSPNGRPRKKQFFADLTSKYTGYSSIVGVDCYTSNGTKEQLEIFGSAVFAFPKSVNLVKELVEQVIDKNDIVLDSFAGSGTTAHAVMQLNMEKHTTSKFILIETMGYAEKITSERAKRVICGYGSNGNTVAGTGGSFSFYELGAPLLIGENLNDAVSTEKIREYIYYMETRQALPPASDAEPMLLGVHHGAAYYFNYDKNAGTTLNRAFLRTIRTRAEAYVIYADTCVLSEQELEKFHITFKKIPRDIARL